MKALVIGYGSIGSRHAKLLSECGCETAVVSQRPIDFPVAYSDLHTALDRHQPGYVVVANATSLHFETLEALAEMGFAGRLLIEKPLFGHWRPVDAARYENVFVAYNLRFHPLLMRLRELIAGETVLSIHAYAGQYLPDWRPGTDYRDSYSANAEQGGGALRDLSHELDYLTWLFGKWTAVAAIGGHFSSLEIDSDDSFALLMRTAFCPVVTLQLNYLDRAMRRSIIVNTADHTMEVDLAAGRLKVDCDVEESFVQRDHTYRAMHMAAFSGDTSMLCSLAEGLEVLQLIGAVEDAARDRKWVVR